MPEKTKAQLEAENAELRRMLADRESAPTPATYEPSFEMSAGVQADIEQAQAMLEQSPEQPELLVGDPMRGGYYLITRDADPEYYPPGTTHVQAAADTDPAPGQTRVTTDPTPADPTHIEP